MSSNANVERHIASLRGSNPVAFDAIISFLGYQMAQASSDVASLSEQALINDSARTEALVALGRRDGINDIINKLQQL